MCEHTRARNRTSCEKSFSLKANLRQHCKRIHIGKRSPTTMTHAIKEEPTNDHTNVVTMVYGHVKTEQLLDDEDVKSIKHTSPPNTEVDDDVKTEAEDMVIKDEPIDELTCM